MVAAFSRAKFPTFVRKGLLHAQASFSQDTINGTQNREILQLFEDQSLFCLPILSLHAIFLRCTRSALLFNSFFLLLISSTPCACRVHNIFLSNSRRLLCISRNDFVLYGKPTTSCLPRSMTFFGSRNQDTTVSLTIPCASCGVNSCVGSLVSISTNFL